MKQTATEHIGAAALAVCRGWKILDIKPSDIPSRFVVVFEAEARKDISDYFQGGTVEARAHQDAVLRILAMMREAKRGVRYE